MVSAQAQDGSDAPWRQLWQPRLAGPLAPGELETVLDQAVATLERIGLACQHRGAIERLASERGIEHRDGRLRFAPERVLDLVERARRSARPAPDDGKLSLGGCWACLCYCDPATLQVRKATTAEASQMARLWDARGLGGVVPLMPGDAPPALATLAAERIALLESRGLGGGLPVLDPEEARYLIEMNQAAGRRYGLLQQVLISPLRLNHEGLETALQFLGRPDVEVSLAGSIPMLGVTCPLEPRAALVQALAEELGFAIVCHVLTGADGIGCPRVEPFDMRDATIVFGSPEWCLLRAMVFQVYEFVTGMPLRFGAFRSVAKQPDAQAASERMASVLWQALFGSRRFGGVGQLSIDEVFSPQQVILDGEILGYVQRVVAGLRWEAEGDALAAISEGIAEGSFAGLESTARRFRGFYSFPDLFRHWNVGRWQAEGARSVLSVAWDRARQLIAQSDYHLPQEQVREVEGVYRRASAYIRSRRG